MSDHRDFDHLAVGYAFHALEPADEQLMASHLTSCACCVALMIEAESVTTALAQSVAAAAPPAGLRERLLRAAAAESRVAALPMPQDPWAMPVEPHGTLRVRARGRLLVGALVVIVGIAVAIPTTRALSRPQTAVARDGALAQKMLEPGSREVTLTGTRDSVHAKAVLTSSGALVIADDLPANDLRRTIYVVWAANKSGQRTAIATFDITGKAAQIATTPLPFKVNDITQIAVSYEPGRRAPQAPSDIVLST
jgi:hypothetical protein